MTSVLSRINSRESKTLPLAAGDVCKISLLPNKQYVPYVAICSNASFGSGCGRCALIHVLVPGANTDTPNKRGGSSVYVCSNIRLTLVGVWVGVGGQISAVLQ